jgi:hypothetical protein
MYSVVKTTDEQHLCISYHKSRAEAELRRDLEVLFITELIDNVSYEAWIGTNYGLKLVYPQYAGYINYRVVHPEIEHILDKINKII